MVLPGDPPVGVGFFDLDDEIAGTETPINIDEMVAVPISDDTNFPLDIAHQALRPVDLEQNSQ